MTLTALIHKSITFATKVHRTQKRKGKEIPYITHPLTVALILSRVTDDENVICAGILHDTIEDCEPYGSVTKELLEKEFNGEIAQMVDDVTEQNKTLPWKERKMKALSHIKDMDHDSLLVKSADVLHNLVDLLEDVKIDGDKVFSKFNASKADTIKRYSKLIPEIRKVWNANPLMDDLEDGLGGLLN